MRRIVKIAFAKRLKSIENYSSDPLSAQRNIFYSLIDKAKNTVWGQKYNYIHIDSMESFANQVPISSYEDLEPYIQRMLSGQADVLWPNKINKFSKSSGTTGSKSKFIPVSDESLKECHYQTGKDALLSYLKQRPQSKILTGLNFSLGGSRQNEELGKDKFIGDISAILMSNLPIWAKMQRVPRLSVACMKEWEDKINKIAKIISRRNLVSISGVPSWNLVILNKILELKQQSDLSTIWPKFEVFIHGGVDFAPYQEQFKQIMPPHTNYLEVYNASEGFFAFQDDLDRHDMLLALDNGVFYEFVALEDLDQEHPKSLNIEQVELNKNYAIIISTNAGLWRYLIGDTVKFTSLYPHRIVVSGRTKSFINAFGEELIVENANQAIAKTCESLGVSIKDYTAAPIYMNNNSQGGHQWLIEFNSQPQDLQEFAVVLDKELKKLNSDYEAKRYQDKVLALPKIDIAKRNLFYTWLEQHRRLGSQSKVPRLSNNRKIMEEMLAMNK